MRALSALLSGEVADLDLDRAALQIAEIEYPGLDPEPSLTAFEAIAARLRRRLAHAAAASERVAATNTLLFGELGFRGNEADYYNPQNSCLNEVLEQRTGIPITLSLVYMEVARRVEMPVYGIGLPGHFIVQYDDGESTIFIDPFHCGRLLTREDCLSMVRERVAVDRSEEETLLARFSKKQILVRMLHNLRGVYLRLQAFPQAAQVLSLLIAANPSSPDEHKQRGVVHLHLRKLSAAAADLHEYLCLCPQAADRDEIKRQLEAIHRFLGALN